MICGRKNSGRILSRRDICQCPGKGTPAEEQMLLTKLSAACVR